ncbi:MAG: hypothetical protein AAF497_16205 [Planctomycetota bacterium]
MSKQPYTTDTSPEAEAPQLELWGRMTGQERVQKAMALSSQIRSMAFDAIRQRHPDWDEDQVQLKFIELTYGEELAADFARWKAERSVESA